LSTAVHHGSGGRWHDSATEVFACDLPILAGDVETRYCPHPGLPRPEQVDGLAEWWTAAIENLRGPAVHADGAGPGRADAPPRTRRSLLTTVAALIAAATSSTATAAPASAVSAP